MRKHLRNFRPQVIGASLLFRFRKISRSVVERPDPEGRSYDPSRVFFHRPGSWWTIHPGAAREGRAARGVDRSGLEVLVHLLLGDQSVLELLPQPVAQVVVLGFGHLGLALVETHGRQRLIFRFETAKQQFTAAEG